MKKLLILVPVILVAFLVMSAFFGGTPQRIATSFATTVSMKYHYNDKAIDVVITDANDLRALKDILAGFAYKGSGYPACMFDANVSITLTNGRKSITFCPAFCGDPLVEIDQTGTYLHMSDKRRRALDHICRKYGVVFPVK